MKVVSITGSSGFVGTNLKNLFESIGFKVIGISRSDLKDMQKLTSIISSSDIVINLAGANIINRWSESYKKILIASRIDTTQALIEAMHNAEEKPELFISTSAVGIYKNLKCYDEENFDYEEDFLGKLCKTWENEALKAKELDIRTVIFRFGIVLGKGGALAKMLTPFKLGLGGIIGNGKQDFSFIHLDDLLNAYMFIYENENLDGIFNLTSPKSTTNSTLTKTIGKALSRPTIFPVPEFVLKMIFSEGAKVLTDGQCVRPKRLLENGFKFKFNTIEAAINDLCN
ncbi:TIGR01777 family oxidoreductase [Arcobacter sp. LA11]|uniref:TIGR01777 family oxidoreductase n=1 Tax=Arcobacter sp. LA11 TaxID=1898176 RepID=UPI00093556B6|nr:TIGR01777 family oxidoreductase [Arcobacter sp. LA11]